MTEHPSHNMQLTSLLTYFPEHSQQEFNQKFRQEVKRDIINLLQKHNNLTDREMANMLGYEDPNKVRPRRNELSNPEYNKRNKRKIRDGILVEDKKRICTIGLKLSIAWKLSLENLNAYMEG